jgi:vacuolar-type H+-ATPase subunit D/Vma8
MPEFENELERVIVLAECSESMDAIMLAAEIRRLRGRLEAVERVVLPAAEYGDDIPALRVLEAVRGE